MMVTIAPFQWDVVSGKHKWPASTYRLLEIETTDHPSNEETLLRFVVESDRTTVQNRLANVTVESPFYQIGYRVSLPNGLQRDLVEKGEAFFNDSGSAQEVLGTISVVNKAADMPLAVDKLSIIVNEQADAVVVVDMNGITRFANPAAEKIVNRKGGELIGTQFGIPLTQDKIAEVQMLIPDKGAIYAEMHIAQTEWDREPAQLVSFRDVTDRKNAELALIEQKERLDDLVTEQTIELLSKTKRLEGALKTEVNAREMQKSFISMVSHELRTPLTIVDSTAQRMVRRKDIIESQEIVDRCVTVRKAVNRMLKLIEATLNSAKLDEGKVDFAPTECSTKELIIDICRRHEGMQNTHAINTELDQLPERAVIDPMLFEQIIVNLISNGVKYSPDSNKIDVVGRLVDGHIRIDVRDYGLGIPQAQHHKVFERFFRADTTKHIPGTGLGLHVVSHFAKLHGGEITFVSAENEGSVFKLLIPFKGS